MTRRYLTKYASVCYNKSVVMKRLPKEVIKMVIRMTQKAEDTELARIFMTRDHMSRNEAAAKVEEMRSLVWDGEDPEDLLWEEGMEPDYIMDLI